MKKIFPITLLVLVLINLFAPIGIVINSKDEFQIKKNIAQADDCSIVSAIWDPSGEQKKDDPGKFFTEGITAKIIVKTKNCVTQPNITLTVFEADTCGINCDDALEDSGLLRRVLSIPADNFTIQVKLGEEECEASLGYDCDLFFYLRQGDSVLYNSYGKTGGELYYECDGFCDINASFLGITSQGSDTNPIKDEVVNITGQEAVINKGTYKLLAPIGDFKEIQTDGTGTCPGNEDMKSGLGCYLNILFKIGIGVCGVLAVIMIVVGGIQYMGQDSVFGKVEAKQKIFAALFGLLIALGAFALLNTIDPNLTGKGGVKVDQVSAMVAWEKELENITEVGPGVTVNGQTVKIKTGRAAPCAGGLVNIPSVIRSNVSGKICKDLADKLVILKSKNSNWQITSAMRGANAESTCHYSGRTGGNCVDIQMLDNPRQGYVKSNMLNAGSTNPKWSDLCVAIADVGGINFANEASHLQNCQGIKKYKAFKYTSGPNLHINYIGG